MNNIVLINPVIPQNTGNIIRTCVVTNTKLHIILPIGFSLTDKAMKRAGLDYYKAADMSLYQDFNEFEIKNHGIYHFFTRYSKRIYSDDDFSSKDNHYLFFGHEHDGIPKEILKRYLNFCVRIPMYSDSRSLNLSNSVAIGLYEALRQQNFDELSLCEVQKGEDFLYK